MSGSAVDLEAYVAAWRPPRENIYGSVRRLKWIRQGLRRTDRVLEVGCGTGYMLTMPLIKASFDVQGLDLDETSIGYGRRIAEMSEIDPERLVCRDLADVPEKFDAIILSEVLEHQSAEGLIHLLGLVHDHLDAGGRLFVTVPNGRGWYELEAFLWARLSPVLRALRFEWAVGTIKQRVIGVYEDGAFPSTADGSPHLQRFTLRSIRKVLVDAGFDVVSSTGTVLICGPFSNTLLTGFTRVMRLNARLGDRFPRAAADFMLLATKR